MPTQRFYSHFMYTPLRVEWMQEAAAYLEGKHDFASFCSVDSQAESTVRTIYGIEILEEKNMVKIRISGNGFLYNMVRIIAGTLIEAGYHWRSAKSIGETLLKCDRQAAGATAPACGLTLMGIYYDEALLLGSGKTAFGEKEDFW